MRAKLRVLMGTAGLALLGGLAAGQPPKVAPPAPPMAIALSADGASLSGAVFEFQWALEAQHVVAVHQNLAAAPSARDADALQHDAQMMEAHRAVRAKSWAAQQQAGAAQLYSPARTFDSPGRQLNGPAPADLRSQGAESFPGRFRGGERGRYSGDLVDAHRGEVVHSEAAGPGSVAQTAYAEFARGLADRAVTKQVEIGIKSAEHVPPTPTPPGASPPDGAPGIEDDARPVVYRPGRQPAGLPDWFVRLDTDHDGQVGLYEWKVSGRSMEEFAAIDRNDDGLITAEEMLGYLAHQPRERAAGPTVLTANR
ncbi:MAG TPA: hypothetical protein VH120_08925 [Gemmataceae bacterium]|jgi:hypothetical protein|nr:hypothetical protein [Gemmataceae bacterium]